MSRAGVRTKGARPLLKHTRASIGTIFFEVNELRGDPGAKDGGVGRVERDAALAAFFDNGST
jgi:hypothetical protein